MKRWLFNILSALSLLVFGWVVVLWVQSYCSTVLYRFGQDQAQEIFLMRGQVIYNYWCHGWYTGREWTDWRYLGFGYYNENLLKIRVPHWFLAVLALAMPGLWLWCFVRRRGRAVTGLCPKCGYDLRASKDRCPECGTPIPAGASPVGEDKTVSRSS